MTTTRTAQVYSLRKSIEQARNDARSTAFLKIEADLQPRKDELRLAVCALVRSGIGVSQVARGAGMSRTSVYAMLAETPEVEDLGENGW